MTATMSLPLLKRATEDGVTFVLTPRHAPRSCRRMRRAPRMPLARPGRASSTAFTSTWASASAASAASSPATSRTATRRRSTGGASAKSKAACIRTPQRVVPVDGLQSLPRADVPEGLSRSTRTRRIRRPASCCTAPTPASAASTARGTARTACRSTTPSAASSASATCATAGWRWARRRRACRACPRGAIADRDRQRRRAGARRRRVGAAPATGLPSADRQHLDDAHHAAGESAAERAAASISSHVEPERSALAARRDDGAHAALGRRVRDDLAAAAARRVDAAWRRGADVARASAALALGASTLHLGRPIYAYRALKMWRRSWLSREVLLFGRSPAWPALYAGVALVRLPGQRWRSAALTRAARPRRRHRERVHLSRAVAAGLEHAATRWCSST